MGRSEAEAAALLRRTGSDGVEDTGTAAGVESHALASVTERSWRRAHGHRIELPRPRARELRLPSPRLAPFAQTRMRRFNICCPADSRGSANSRGASRS